MTLESWSMGIASQVMDQFSYAWAFFIPFIPVPTSTILNLFIAIAVSAMQSYSESEHQETVQAPQVTGTRIEADMCGELQKLRNEIIELKWMLANISPNAGEPRRDVNMTRNGKLPFSGPN